MPFVSQRCHAGTAFPIKVTAVILSFALLGLIDGRLDQRDLDSCVLLAFDDVDDAIWDVKPSLPFIKQHQWSRNCLKLACGAMLCSLKNRAANCPLQCRIVLFLTEQKKIPLES